MPELTEPHARHLAGILNLIRPDWPVPSLLTLIWEHRQQPDYPALVVAATTKAQDRTCKTPAPIFIPGNHWPEAIRHQLPPLPRCEDHDTEDAPNCRSCLADVKAGDRPENMIGKRTTPTVTPGRSPRPNRTRRDPALATPKRLPAGGDLPDSNERGRAIPRTTPTEAPE